MIRLFYTAAAALVISMCIEHALASTKPVECNEMEHLAHVCTR